MASPPLVSLSSNDTSWEESRIRKRKAQLYVMSMPLVLLSIKQIPSPCQAVEDLRHLRP